MTSTKDVKFFCGEKALSKWLRAKRLEKKLTMEDVSIRLGLSPNSYSVVDCGDRRATAAYMDVLGPLYGVDSIVLKFWLLANNKIYSDTMRELTRRFVGKSDKKCGSLTLRDVVEVFNGCTGDHDQRD